MRHDANATEMLKTLDNDVLVREFLSTYIGDQQGNFTIFPNQNMASDFDPRMRPWYKGAVSADGLFITDPFLATTGKLQISVASPLKKNGSLTGVAASSFSIESLVSMVNSVDMGGKGSAFLVKQDGTILVHRNSNLVTKTLKDAYPTNTPAVGSSVTETTFADANVLVSFLPIRGLPRGDWYLAVQIDRDLAYAGINEFRTAAAVATLVGVVAMIAILAVLLSRLVVRPVVNMTGVMAKLARGNVLTEIPCTDRNDEVGQMAAAVAVFRDNIVERGRLAREAEETRAMTEQERRAREAAKTGEAEQIAFAVNSLADSLGRLANGDLDRLRTDFNASVKKLHDALAIVGQNAKAIDSGAVEIRSSADHLASRTKQQAASVEETAAALEEVTTTVKDSARRAEEVAAAVLFLASSESSYITGTELAIDGGVSQV